MREKTTGRPVFLSILGRNVNSRRSVEPLECFSMSMPIKHCHTKPPMAGKNWSAGGRGGRETKRFEEPVAAHHCRGNSSLIGPHLFCLSRHRSLEMRQHL